MHKKVQCAVYYLKKKTLLAVLANIDLILFLSVKRHVECGISFRVVTVAQLHARCRLSPYKQTLYYFSYYT